MDFLLDLPKDINLENLDKESIKTPKKDPIKKDPKIISS